MKYPLLNAVSCHLLCSEGAIVPAWRLWRASTSVQPLNRIIPGWQWSGGAGWDRLLCKTMREKENKEEKVGEQPSSRNSSKYSVDSRESSGQTENGER